MVVLFNKVIKRGMIGFSIRLLLDCDYDVFI